MALGGEALGVMRADVQEPGHEEGPASPVRDVVGPLGLLGVHVTHELQHPLVGLLAAGEGVSANYNDRDKSYRVDVMGQPGALVEVNIVEPQNHHVIGIARGVIGQNGELTLQGQILPGGLGAGNHLEVKVNGVTKIDFK